MNLLFNSVGSRSYLIKYFKDALGDKGKIFAANSSPISTAMEEADERVVTPLIYSGEYIDFLLKYCQEHSIDAIIPLFDIDLPILARNRGKFESCGVRLIVADSSIIEICNDKWKTFCFLKNNGFNVIPTFLNIEDTLESIKKEVIRYPLIIKPRWGMGSIAIYQADNYDELCVLYRKSQREVFESYLKYESSEKPDESVIIQQKMFGQEYGMDNICDLSGKYIKTIIREKMGMRAGETDCAKIVENPKLLDEARKLAILTKHPANMDIDVIVSDGLPYILEMNARFGGGYPFGHVAGVNLPQAIICWLNFESVDYSILEPKIGIVAQKKIDIMPLHLSDS
jgi:carbamoyl-phosphate synthase large subunit